jgi:hypothetical protein
MNVNLLLTAGRSTTETARHHRLLLPLAPSPAALPLMTGLAPPSNMFVTPPPPSQLQIDLALQATVPPQASSAIPPSCSIDAEANPQFILDFHITVGEQRLREERCERDPAHLRNPQMTNTILVHA